MTLLPQFPALDARLDMAARFIHADVHADIGSDHAHLPLALITRGQVRRCVIVEKNPGPFERSRERVRRENLTECIDVRLGDGFAPLQPGEVESVSITGMGARTMLGILGAAVALPYRLVLQANDAPELLRQWAFTSGYHLMDEALVPGFWTYAVLHLEQGGGEACVDAAYQGLERDVALRWGPHLLRRRDPLLREQLGAQEARLRRVAVHGRADVQRELDLIERAARHFG